MLCLLCSLKETSTDVPPENPDYYRADYIKSLQYMYLSVHTICRHWKQIANGGGQGNNNQKVFNFSKSKFQVYF